MEGERAVDKFFQIHLYARDKASTFVHRSMIRLVL